MEDLKSAREMFKLMWLPGEKAIIWELMEGKQIPIDSRIYQIVGRHIDLNAWCLKFEKLYNAWLDADVTDVFDLHHHVNQEILTVL